MDNAVALVRAYLHVNGYLTVTEYPILESDRYGKIRSVTDMDVLAFRFERQDVNISELSRNRPPMHQIGFSDPILKLRPREPDMLIAEVKEGRARLDDNALRPDVIQTTLARFGCCSLELAPTVASELLTKGEASVHSHHRVRYLIFASDTDSENTSPYLTISLGHVVSFLRSYLKSNWNVLRHAQLKDPAFGFLMTLEKAERGSSVENT